MNLPATTLVTPLATPLAAPGTMPEAIPLATPLAIALEEVQYAWPGQPIPQLQIAAGERVFLRGPSGSGKSTLLGLVGGVLLPATGSVQLFGERIDTQSASARDHFRADHLGFIFQWFNLVPYLSVLDNVLLPTLFSTLRKQRAGADPATQRLGSRR